MASIPYAGESLDPIGEGLISLKEDKASKGTANGYAPLDANAKVPVANLPEQASLDAEVAAAVSAHNALTNPHGISNTANLVYTSDARLSDSRTPTPHKSSHATGGTDALNPSDIGAQPAGSYAPATGISPSAITGTAVVTNDSRLSDPRTPTSHSHAISDVTSLQTTLDGKALSSHTHAIANITGLQTALDGKQASGSYAPTAHNHAIADVTNLQTTLDGKALSSHAHTIADVTGLQTAIDGKQASGSYAPATGISPSAITGTAVVTNDSRLSDTRDPKAHTHGNITNDGKIPFSTTAVGSIIPTESLDSLVNGLYKITQGANVSADAAIGGTVGAKTITVNTTGTGYANGSATINGIAGVGTSGSANVNILIGSSYAFGQPLMTGNHGVVSIGSFGTTANTFCQGNDARLSHTRAGTNNINVGETALSSPSLTGSGNSAVGASALASNTTGGNNTASGVNALSSNTTGSSNTAIGVAALNSSTISSDNVAIGVSAGFNVTGSSNTLVGRSCGGRIAGGNFNVAVGTTALNGPVGTSSGSGNVAIGNNALSLNTASNNVAVGNLSLFNNDTGFYNTAVGSSALRSNTTGINNTASGANVLQFNTTGDNNTASGVGALLYNTTGASNTAIGVNALATNTTSQSNTAVGVNALNKNSGNFNSSFGVNSLQKNTTGFDNCAFGSAALSNNLTANLNTAVGANAGSTLTIGSENIIIGANSNVDSNARNRCVALGFNSLTPAVDGSLAIGSAGSPMGNLLSGAAGGNSGQHLVIYLNGTQYKIKLENP